MEWRWPCWDQISTVYMGWKPMPSKWRQNVGSCGLHKSAAQQSIYSPNFKRHCAVWLEWQIDVCWRRRRRDFLGWMWWSDWPRSCVLLGRRCAGWQEKWLTPGGWHYVYAIAPTQQVDCHKSLVNSLIAWLWRATLAFTIHMLYKSKETTWPLTGNWVK